MKRILHRRSQPERAGDIGEFDWWWLPAAMRAVTLAQGLFISLVGSQGLLTVTVPLIVLAVVATLVEATRLARWWTVLAEGVLASLIVGAAGSAAVVGLPYLVVPGFAAGLRFGLLLGLGTSALVGVVFVALFASVGPPASSAELASQAVQWGALGSALAALGGWGYRQRQGRPAEDIAYETASRLLEDLQDLAPLLTVGLDSRTIAEGVLDEVQDTVGYRQAAILVGSPHGPRTVATRGAGKQWLTSLELSEMALGSNHIAPVHGLPGTYCFSPSKSPGWLMFEPESPLDAVDKRQISHIMARQSRRLAAAQAFETVRDLAAHEERRRIGREIHDGIAQDLASLAYEVESTASDSERDQKYVRSLRELVRDLRLSVFEMREGGMGEVNLADEISEHAGRVAGLGDLELRLTVRDSHTPIDPRVSYELSKIAAEALTNVRRHAGARTLWVNIHHDGDHIRVAIADDGRGIDGQRDRASSGLGIMRERADSIGARLFVRARAGGGTVVIVEYPTETDAQQRHAVSAAGR